MEYGVVGKHTRLCAFIPDIGTHVMEWPCQEQRGPGPLLFTPIQYGPLCGL